MTIAIMSQRTRLGRVDCATSSREFRLLAASLVVGFKRFPYLVAVAKYRFSK
jgi:hypothetical protein